MKRIEVKSGDIYGRWTIIDETDSIVTPSGSIKRMFYCKCSCGTKSNVKLNDLRTGNSKSCGCLQKEITKERSIGNEYGKLQKGHRLRNTTEYRIWANIKSRCLNQNFTNFKYYGGRGITIHEDFLIFENFYNYLKSSIGLRPGPEYSIDRIDVNGNYTYGNLRWATHSEQMNNRRPYSEWNIKKENP